jgi:NADH-quinone oxidoreductase subunit A
VLNIEDYLPILVFLALAVGLSLALLVLSYARSRRNAYAQKVTPYECGFDAFDLPKDNARGRFDVQFYLVAILFIIFDVEIAFLFPWATALKEIGWFGFASMMLFLTVLTIGFIYEWMRGGLEWE